ncbi:MAG: glycosyltransferase family 4 protein [Potamolinea sp.]
MQRIWERGGVATYIRRISKAQRAAGHTVFYLDNQPFTGAVEETVDSAIVVRDDNDLFIQAKAYELDILHLHATVSVLPPENTPVIRTIHGNNPYCPSGSRYLKRWSQPCDRAYSLGGCLWGHIVDHCGSIRPQRLYPEFERTWQEMRTLREIPVITNSKFVKDQMIQSGYRAEMIHVLHFPAPEIGDYFPPEQTDLPHFVFLGRITPEKGISWLLQALAEVKVPIHMDIAGSGNQEQEQQIHRLAEQLGLMNKITFHGWVNEAKAIQLIQGARALVFPSVWHEPAGIVSLEAAAAGRAIIASKVGGIPEYVGRLQNALLVEPNDVRGLAQSIEQLATDCSLAKQMGTQGRQRAKEHFCLEKHLEELMKLYELSVEKISCKSFPPIN